MLIRSVEIKNFRSIREACLDCDTLTAILGRNGAGKSSFLHAIDYFYNIAAPVTEEDFFDRDTGSHIEIRVTYGDLREDEREEFSAYVKEKGDTLMVTKRISSENGRIAQRYYAAALQIPEFAEVRSIPGRRDRVTKWNELVEQNVLPGLGEKARSADQVGHLMREYESGHLERCEPIEQEEQFFGARNIGGGKLDKFTTYVLVPAVRAAIDEASDKKGAIYQILDMIVLREINVRQDIQEFKADLEERVKRLYSPDNLKELPMLGESISQTLDQFAPDARLNLLWDEAKVPDVPLPAARATLVEDEFDGDISRKGHGLQRALILTLLQHLAATVPLQGFAQEEREEGDVTEAHAVEASRGPDLIIAIEEPELYLHPPRCRYLAEVLLQLAENPGLGLGARNQIIYATHSPYFVDLDRFNQIRTVRKASSPDSIVKQSVVESYSLEQAAQEIARIYEADTSTFTVDSFKARTTRVMTTVVNEGFFADVVVVVEGACDGGVLWKLQEIMRRDWAKRGIVIASADGKNNLARPTVIFRGLSIDTYLIFDGDSKHMGADGEGDARKWNHRCLRLVGAPVEDFPETQVHDTWAVFKDDIEGIIREQLGGQVFQEILREVGSELGYDREDRVWKNVVGAGRVIGCIYERAYEIPILEEIVEKVTELSDYGRADDADAE